MSDFDQFAALSFDCYGTLIDWEAGILAELRPWAEGHGLTASDGELIGAFAEVETAVQQQHPATLYPDVLAETLRLVGARLGVSTSEAEAAAFGASVGCWPAFRDSADALARLKQRYKLIILSNVDRASFARSNERLGVEFDLIVTAEDVGAYKPSERSFPALFARLASIGIARERLLHVAQSLYHDHEPAHALGLPSVWIDRRHDQPGSGATPQPHDSEVMPRWRYPSLAAFADAALAPS
jgi:putative hydrolase of the HAD superfamily